MRGLPEVELRIKLPAEALACETDYDCEITGACNATSGTCEYEDERLTKGPFLLLGGVSALLAAVCGGTRGGWKREVLEILPQPEGEGGFGEVFVAELGVGQVDDEQHARELLAQGEQGVFRLAARTCVGSVLMKMLLLIVLVVLVVVVVLYFQVVSLYWRRILL